MKIFNVVKLEDLVSRVKVGFVGSINNYYCNPSDGVPLIRTTDIVDIDSGQLKFVTKEFHNKNKKSQVKKGDLIVARHGDNGAAIVFDKDYEAQVLNAVIIETDAAKLSPYLLKIFLELPFVKKQIKGAIKGSVQGVINTQHIADLFLPINNQINYEGIESLIFSIDKKIELNNRINAELEAMAKTLYDYWFVQFDFPDANGKPYKTAGGKMVYNATLKREIPEGWVVKKLKEISSMISRGISPKYIEKGGIAVLNQKCVREQRISFEDARRHKIELINDDKRLLQLFDVLVNSTGVGTLGRVAYVKRLLEKKTTVDSHISIIRANAAEISPQYLSWVLMRHQPTIEAAANGSTGQVELSKKFLEDIDVVIPSKTIVDKFTDFVNPIVNEIATKESESEILVKLRDWLLPMLMNGQVTIED